MDVASRIRKYYPLLLKGEINQDQYERVIHFKTIAVRDPEVISSEAFISGFGGVEDTEGIQSKRSDICGDEEEYIYSNELEKKIRAHGFENEITRKTTHPRRVSGLSQKNKLLTLLKTCHTWVETPAIQKAVYGGDHLGSARIPARICELRKEGYEIESRKVEGSIWAYRLKESVFSRIASNFGSG